MTDWPTKWAEIFPNLIGELPIDLLDDLKIAFKQNGATSMKNLFINLNGRVMFTGPNKNENLNKLYNILCPEYDEIDAVIEFKKTRGIWWN